MPDNRGALITWSADVSVVAAAFLGVLVSRATTPLFQNSWFIVCLMVACLVSSYLTVSSARD